MEVRDRHLSLRFQIQLKWMSYSPWHCTWDSAEEDVIDGGSAPGSQTSGIFRMDSTIHWSRNSGMKMTPPFKKYTRIIFDDILQRLMPRFQKRDPRFCKDILASLKLSMRLRYNTDIMFLDGNLTYMHPCRHALTNIDKNISQFFADHLYYMTCISRNTSLVCQFHVTLFRGNIFPHINICSSSYEIIHHIFISV